MHVSGYVTKCPAGQVSLNYNDKVTVATNLANIGLKLKRT